MIRMFGRARSPRPASVIWRRSCAVALSVALLGVLDSCGGGGGGSSTSQPPPVAAKPVQLKFLADQSRVRAGQSPTLYWSAVNAAQCTASGDWSGSKAASGNEVAAPLAHGGSYAIQCVDSTGTMSAQASLQVVMLPAVSDPTTTQVTSQTGAGLLSYRIVDIGSQDAAWDAVNQKLQLLTSTTSANYPSSVVSVDPTTGAVTASYSLGFTPSAMALSADGQYIYVGKLYGGGLLRLHASDLTVDFALDVGASNSTVLQIAVSPTSSHTAAILADQFSPTEFYPVLIILDDATPRPVMLSGITTFNSQSIVESYSGLVWSEDASTLYVGASPGVGAYLTVSPTSQGPVITNLSSAWMHVGGRLHGSTLYSGKTVYDISGHTRILGTYADFDAAGPNFAESVSNNKVFLSLPNIVSQVQDGALLVSYDLASYSVLDALVLNGAASFGGGRTVTWGVDGIALAGDKLFIGHGSFASAAVPPAPQPTAAIVASGVLKSGSGPLSYQVIDAGASDLIADSCNHVYVTTSSYSTLPPDSLLEFDLATSSFTRSVHVGSDPENLAVSDDCSTIYVGLHGSSSVTRIQASNLSPLPPASLPDLFPTPFAQSMAVKPGSPLTLAVAMGDATTWSLCRGATPGLVVFDDVVSRSTVYSASQDDSLRSIVWSSADDLLYGESWTSIYSVAVDAAGPGTPTLLATHPMGYGLYDDSRDLYIDQHDQRLLDSFGNYYATTAGNGSGKIPLPGSSYVDGGCGSPMSARTTDSGSGKLFFVQYAGSSSTQTQGLEISSYDPATLKKLDSVHFDPADAGLPIVFPMRLVRASSDSIALVTDYGQLIVFKGPMLTP